MSASPPPACRSWPDATLCFAIVLTHGIGSYSAGNAVLGMTVAASRGCAADGRAVAERAFAAVRLLEQVRGRSVRQSDPSGDCGARLCDRSPVRGCSEDA